MASHCPEDQVNSLHVAPKESPFMTWSKPCHYPFLSDPQAAQPNFLQQLRVSHFPLAKCYLSFRSPTSYHICDSAKYSLTHVGPSVKWPTAPTNSPLITYAYCSISSSPQIAISPGIKEGSPWLSVQPSTGHITGYLDPSLSLPQFSQRPNDVENIHSSHCTGSVGRWEDTYIWEWY